MPNNPISLSMKKIRNSIAKQTLHGGGNEASMRSSKQKPGMVSIKYSEKLLVEAASVSLTTVSEFTEELKFSLLLLLQSHLALFVLELSLFLLDLLPLPSLLCSVVKTLLLLLQEDEDGSPDEKEEDSESLVPVRRNLSCFSVCSLAL